MKRLFLRLLQHSGGPTRDSKHQKSHLKVKGECLQVAVAAHHVRCDHSTLTKWLRRSTDC